MNPEQLQRLQDNRKAAQEKAQQKSQEKFARQMAAQNKVALKDQLKGIFFVDGSDIEEARLLFTSSGYYRRFGNVIEYINRLLEIELRNYAKKPPKPEIDFNKVKKFVVEPPATKQKDLRFTALHEPNPKQIIPATDKPKQERPPAVYSNSTPYGIAAEMLREQ